jgi:hypothetical protein
MQPSKENIDAFERVVLAGMRLMYDKRTFEIFKRGLLREDRPVPQRLAAESAGLMKMLYDKSNGQMPKNIIAPAASMLLMEMGKFMTEAGIAQVSSDDVRQGTQLLMGMLKQMFGGAQTPAQPAPATQGV